MRKLYKKKLNKNLLYLLIFLSFISLISIYSASNLIGNKSIFFKQIAWLIFGFFCMHLILKIGNKKIYSNYKLLYILGNISLLLLLFFATPINNSKCWFNLFNVATIQPSEFMKIILIITNSIIISKNKNNKEYVLIFKVFIVTLIPSILTFLEPDTGMVLIYFIISFVMLFCSGINIKWFTYTFLILLLFLSIFFSLYFFYSNIFIDIFGTNFFYRINRLLDWKNGSGMQLENALISMGSSYIVGHGFNNTPIYFPEAQTDFIFSVYITNFGFIGGCILIFAILFLDFNILNIAIKCKSKINKNIVVGILGMLIYQQIQHIGMNIGLLPITGITLPFISYGGSSLLSYMICIAIIFNAEKKT